MLRIRGASASWWMGAAVSALLFVPSLQAASAPASTTPRRTVERGNSWQTRTAEASRGVVVASVLFDHFRPSDSSSDPAASARSSREAVLRGTPRSRASLRAPTAIAPHEVDLRAAMQVPDLTAGFTTSASPIPEPTSNFLFLAGVGLIALVARNKFTAPRRIS